MKKMSLSSFLNYNNVLILKEFYSVKTFYLCLYNKCSNMLINSQHKKYKVIRRNNKNKMRENS